jgi:hypothetical protein
MHGGSGGWGGRMHHALCNDTAGTYQFGPPAIGVGMPCHAYIPTWLAKPKFEKEGRKNFPGEKQLRST